MKLKIKKLHPDAKLPTYATNGSACFDIYAFMPDSMDLSIPDRYGAVVPTAISFEIPQGYCVKIYSRSGHGMKGVCLANGTGIIDSDYRQEVKVLLVNHGGSTFVFSHGDRIAQAMLVPVEKVEFEEVEELSQTERIGGFGSTGS